MRLFEILNQDLVQEFKNTKSPKELKTLCTRNNCGQAVIEFLEYLKSRNINGYKVSGYFIADVPSLKLIDFTKPEILEMVKQGYDKNSEHDRLAFAKHTNIVEELKKIPHYWASINGKIYDVSGKEQFVDSGLSPDLHVSRYVENSRQPF